MPASAENPPCPNGSGNRAFLDSPDGYTGSIVCFETDGDWFWYIDSHSDGIKAGMIYRATDGLAHDHDHEKLWYPRLANSGWESLNTNEVEGTAVYYRACLKNFTTGVDYGCSAEKKSFA